MGSALNNGSSRLWRTIRARILMRDNYTCQSCGMEGADSVDHIVPRRLGGTDMEDNLQTLCRTCNSSKGGRFFYNERTPPTPHGLISPRNESLRHEPAGHDFDSAQNG